MSQLDTNAYSCSCRLAMRVGAAHDRHTLMHWVTLQQMDICCIYCEILYICNANYSHRCTCLILSVAFISMGSKDEPGWSEGYASNLIFLFAGARKAADSEPAARTPCLRALSAFFNAAGSLASNAPHDPATPPTTAASFRSTIIYLSCSALRFQSLVDSS